MCSLSLNILAFFLWNSDIIGLVGGGNSFFPSFINETKFSFSLLVDAIKGKIRYAYSKLKSPDHLKLDPLFGYLYLPPKQTFVVQYNHESGMRESRK